MPAKVALLKLTQTDTIKRLYNEHHFIDDFILPIHCLKKSVEKFHEHLNVIEKILNDMNTLHCYKQFKLC